MSDTKKSGTASSLDFYQTSDRYREMLKSRPESDFQNYLRLVLAFCPESSLVLELGSGTGQAALAINQTSRKVIASEVSSLFLEGFPIIEYPAVVSDAGNLSFADETFDAVISNEVVEHLVEVKKVLDEMARVTKVGGLIIVRAPQLASPLWPVLDIPLLLKGQGRPPHYTGFSSALKFCVANIWRTLRIAFAKEPIFHWREPDYSGGGGDADATYWSSSTELVRFFEALNFSILNRVETGSRFSRSWWIGRFTPWLHVTVAVVARKN
jgi:SAM-dependent methyltransferase